MIIHSSLHQKQSELAKKHYRNTYLSVQRHSRLVKGLKFLIPVGSICIIAFLIIMFWLDPFRDHETFAVSDINLSGSSVTMEAPILKGVGKGGKPYHVTASKAVQDLKAMHIINLEKMNASFASNPSGGEVRILADKGVYNSQTEYLEVQGNVIVNTEDSQKIFLSSAAIDAKAGTVRSVEPVKVLFPDGQIHADGLEVFGNGDLISFRKNVETTLYPKEKADERKDTQ